MRGPEAGWGPARKRMPSPKKAGINVAELQRSLVRTEMSHAKEVVDSLLSMPKGDVGFDAGKCDDVRMLRSQLLQEQARVKAYQNAAERACFEVERRYKADASKGAKEKATSSSASTSNDHGGINITRTASSSEKSLVLESISNEASPIPLIDAVGNLISAGENDAAWDLLKDDSNRRATNTTVGIRLALNSHSHDLPHPCQIQIIIPGSSAHICEQLERGDLIVAVDGVPVDESNIVQCVKGSDVVGSKVTLTVKKKGGKGREIQAELVRGAWGAVERKERLFILFEDAIKVIENGGDKEEILGVMSKVVNQARENEKYRALNEMRIHDRLAKLQYEMKAMLAAARQSCTQLLKSHAQANEIMSKHFSELTIPLHERVEEYVKGLQDELDEAQRKRAKSELRVQKGQKIAEAIASMESTVAFARMKLKNREPMVGP